MIPANAFMLRRASAMVCRVSVERRMKSLLTMPDKTGD